MPVLRQNGWIAQCLDRSAVVGARNDSIECCKTLDSDLPRDLDVRRYGMRWL